MNAYDNDNGTEYDDNEIEGDDDKIEDNDEDHEENGTQRGGAGFVKKKHGNTIDHHETGIAIPTATDVLPTTTPEEEEVELRRGKTAEDDEERETKSPPADKTAKQQIKEKLNAALANFKLPKLPKEPANDNFRPVASWPLMDQLTRRTFEPDEKRRTKSISTACYLRGLIDLVNADPLGDETDCDIQRTESGRVHFDNGMSLDRKKLSYKGNRNGEQGAARHDGPVRTAKKVVPIGSRINCNDPFPTRQLAAREDLNEIIVAVGPLWKWLYSALAEDATMTEIGLALGAKGTAAPPLGVRTVRLALSAAMEFLALRKDVSRETIPMPDKSRGSYWNQATGPVVKVAA